MIVVLLLDCWPQYLVGYYRFQTLLMHLWRRWGSGSRDSGRGCGNGGWNCFSGKLTWLCNKGLEIDGYGSSVTNGGVWRQAKNLPYKHGVEAYDGYYKCCILWQLAQNLPWRKFENTVWKHEKGGIYSVIIHDGLPCRDSFFLEIWNKLVTSKVSCFVWRLALNRVPWKENLVDKSLLPPTEWRCVSGVRVQLRQLPTCSLNVPGLFKYGGYVDVG